MSTSDDAAQLLTHWRDPYDPPVLVQHDRFTVVRDDLLKFGSKARFIDALVAAYPHVDEFVYGSCPAQGLAQISLTAVCARHHKSAVYFMADRSRANLTAQQRAGLALGGVYRWVPHGMLNVTQARAREYVAQDPARRMLLPIGLEHPVVSAAIVKVARQLGEPSEVWSVASSGALSRGLQEAWPNAVVHAVSVGHRMSAREIGRAVIWRSEYKFTQRVTAADTPPYPSVANYDAKVWPFVREHAYDGAWVWNVAAD